MKEIWRVSATEVKNSWGRVVRRILRTSEPALVESKGKPTVVILPAEEYERLVTDRTAQSHKQRQLKLLTEAEKFALDVAANYADQSFDSTQLIREARAARDEQLLDLR